MKPEFVESKNNPTSGPYALPRDIKSMKDKSDLNATPDGEDNSLPDSTKRTHGATLVEKVDRDSTYAKASLEASGASNPWKPKGRKD